ncbi:hypothetical protein R7Z36_14530, partial [Vibrio sp. 1762]|nr:hypothetical protein [Vibrio sp. 1762]
LSLYCWVLSKQIDHLKSCPKIGGHFCKVTLNGSLQFEVDTRSKKEWGKNVLEMAENRCERCHFSMVL